MSEQPARRYASDTNYRNSVIDQAQKDLAIHEECCQKPDENFGRLPIRDKADLAALAIISAIGDRCSTNLSDGDEAEQSIADGVSEIIRQAVGLSSPPLPAKKPKPIHPAGDFVVFRVNGMMHTFGLPLSNHDFELVTDAIDPDNDGKKDRMYNPERELPEEEWRQNEADNRTALINRVYQHAARYASAPSELAMTIEDQVHGAVFKALEVVDEYVKIIGDTKPFPFDVNLSIEYGDKRDNAGHDTLGRTARHLDRDLFN